MRRGNRIKSSTVSRLSSPMSPYTAQDDDPPGTASTSSSSCFDVAWHVCSLGLLHVVLVFLSVAVAAAVVVLLPFACMASSLCLVCAITALLLAPRFAPPDRAAERGGGGGSEMDGSDNDNDGASSREEQEHEGEADGYEFSNMRGDEQERFFWVDTGSYYCYKKFYDLLAFWRRKERAGTR